MANYSSMESEENNTMECLYDFVVFDWKGTLERKSNTKDKRTQLAIEAIRKYLDGINVPSETFGDIYHAEMAFVKGESKVVSKNKLLDECFSKLSARVGIDFKSHFKDLRKIYFKQYEGTEKHEMYPGVVELLTKLEKSGTPVALLRNSTLPPAEFQKVMDKFGVDHFFHYDRNIVLSGQIGSEKPDVKVFEAVLSKCNLWKFHQANPKRIVMIGNETECDVQGGKNMNWTSVLVRTTESTSNGLADFECDNLEEFSSFLFNKLPKS